LKACGGADGDSPHVQLLKGIALNLYGKPAEAMRLLETLRSGDYALGALYALKHSHLLAENPDRQSLLEIETAMSSLRDAPVMGLFSAAEALFFQKDYTKAKPILEKLVKVVPQDPMISCLCGWTDLLLGRDQKSTLEMFDRAVEQRYLDGYVGKMAVYMSRQLANDMKAVSKDALTVSFSHLPFHIEATRACLLAKEWNNALQAIQNSNIVESDNVFILFLLAVHTICSSGIKLEQALNELQKARRSIYVVDELRVAISLEDVKEAAAKVKELMTMDSDDPYAALGVTLSNLMNGKVDDASAQLTFMKEANPTITGYAIYHFAEAVIAKYKKNSYEQFIQFINDAIIVHFDKIQVFFIVESGALAEVVLLATLKCCESVTPLAGEHVLLNRVPHSPCRRGNRGARNSGGRKCHVM
uniref:TPR_REGION domain-containing protein n=1 Tax=Heligmosomoides polygyrus TaxID=6339 RepID=A0A183F3E3_HELPZ